MNFQESNQFVEEMEKTNKKKKTVIAAIIILGVIILLLLIAISYIKSQDAKTLKIFINNNQISISPTLLVSDNNGNSYMNVKELANFLDYSYQNGEYKNYTEDSNSCYLKTPYEIISMTADSDTLTKYILNENGVEDKENSDENANELIITDPSTGNYSLNIVVNSENETQETFSLENPIQLINDELYVPMTELARIFSVQLNTSTQNRIRIDTINTFAPAAFDLVTNRLKYNELSNIYENLTTIPDGMLVVGDGNKYGVVSLVDGKEVISLKYDKIIYHQNTQEFFVTAENSVGIVDRDGNTIVKPTAYDAISNYDELNNLYLVEKDGKFGIVNREGETIIHPEYDSIGLKNPEDFADEDVRSFNLLFENSIPVNSNDKVGIIDINGEEKLKCVYDSLGFIRGESVVTEEKTTKNNSSDDEDEEETNTTKKTTTTVPEAEDYDSVLTVPENVGIKGIVVNLNGLYGLYDAQEGRLIIPCACSKIYSKTKSGVTTYYLEFNEQEINMKDYLEQNDLISIKEK